jgi:hypothetical protein
MMAVFHRQNPQKKFLTISRRHGRAIDLSHDQDRALSGIMGNVIGRKAGRCPRLNEKVSEGEE